jgi:hypothetical protein
MGCGPSQEPYIPPNARQQQKQQPIRQQAYPQHGQQQQRPGQVPYAQIVYATPNGTGTAGTQVKPPPYTPNPAYHAAAFQDLNKGVDEIEPMLLLDITGSMNFPISSATQVSRKSVIQESIGIIVRKLGQVDSQAQHEQGDDDEGGGLRTVTFADGKGTDIGDLNGDNLRIKWSKIQFGGGTYLVPGWRELKRVYKEEFGSRPYAEQPKLLCLLITDGEAADLDEFIRLLSNESYEKTYIGIALLGYGEDHEQAYNSFMRLVQHNQHVRLMNFGAESNPAEIANTCLNFVL